MNLFKKLFGKKQDEKTQQELLQIFSEYFAPNQRFFSVPGSAKHLAYFETVDAAMTDMINNSDLVVEATGWEHQKLVDFIQSRRPGSAARPNMVIAGLIFTMGQHAVTKEDKYYVDFSDKIPNCIAIYLLLMAQKSLADRKTMVIDTGDNDNPEALAKAMHKLLICDPEWHYTIIQLEDQKETVYVDPPTPTAASEKKQTSGTDLQGLVEQVVKLLQDHHTSFQQKVQAKEKDGPVSEQELLKLFADYFAPNTDFYAAPGSPKSTAYFKVINAAKEEMLNNPGLFTSATKWEPQQLENLLQNKMPGITNMLICGLIFTMGEYAVIEDVLTRVDFCEAIPNCIAIYLLLTAQKKPADSRTVVIDAGDGCNAAALSEALDTLSVCDPSWHYHIS